jgi:hypothetical protein
MKVLLAVDDSNFSQGAIDADQKSARERAGVKEITEN